MAFCRCVSRVLCGVRTRLLCRLAPPSVPSVRGRCICEITTIIITISHRPKFDWSLKCEPFCHDRASHVPCLSAFLVARVRRSNLDPCRISNRLCHRLDSNSTYPMAVVYHIAAKQKRELINVQNRNPFFNSYLISFEHRCWHCGS